MYRKPKIIGGTWTKTREKKIK